MASKSITTYFLPQKRAASQRLDEEQEEHRKDISVQWPGVLRGWSRRLLQVLCVVWKGCCFCDKLHWSSDYNPSYQLPEGQQKLHEHFTGAGSTGSARKYYLAAVERAESFKSVMENKQVPIAEQLSTIHAQWIADNRRKLKSICETILFCGRQGIALRGHRDDRVHLQQDPQASYGNFQALLKFRIDSGDSVLQQHLASGPRNALYTRKTVQNQLIDTCGHIISSKILQHIQAARFFSSIAHEATDSANDEQLSINLRFVNE